MPIPPKVRSRGSMALQQLFMIASFSLRSLLLAPTSASSLSKSSSRYLYRLAQVSAASAFTSMISALFRKTAGGVPSPCRQLWTPPLSGYRLLRLSLLSVIFTAAGRKHLCL